MKTVFLLLAQFEKAVLPLDEICRDFFALEPNTAKNYAKAGRLPVPAFRTGNTNKSPWFVHISDLATFIDNKRKESIYDHIHSKPSM